MAGLARVGVKATLTCVDQEGEDSGSGSPPPEKLQKYRVS